MKKIIIYLATMLLAAMTFTGCYDLEPIRETKSTKEHFTRPAITLIKA